MDDFTGYIVGAIIGAIISYIILYFIIKAAVRDGIVEARHTDDIDDSDINYDEEEESGISKTTCPNCGNIHDIDYSKCPYCKYQY